MMKNKIFSLHTDSPALPKKPSLMTASSILIASLILTGCAGQGQPGDSSQADGISNTEISDTQTPGTETSETSEISDTQTSDKVSSLLWKTPAAAQPTWQIPDENGNYTYMNTEAVIEKTVMYQSDQVSITADSLTYDTNEWGDEWVTFTLSASNLSDHTIWISIANENNWGEIEAPIGVNGYLLDDYCCYILVELDQGETEQMEIPIELYNLRYCGISEISDIDINFFVGDSEKDGLIEGDYTGYCRVETTAADTHDEMSDGLNSYLYREIQQQAAAGEKAEADGSSETDADINPDADADTDAAPNSLFNTSATYGDSNLTRLKDLKVSDSPLVIRQIVSFTGADTWRGSDGDSFSHNARKRLWRMMVEIENPTDRDYYINIDQLFLNGVLTATGDYYNEPVLIPAGMKKLLSFGYNSFLSVDLMDQYGVDSIDQVEMTIHYGNQEETGELDPYTEEPLTELAKGGIRKITAVFSAEMDSWNTEGEELYKDDRLQVLYLGTGIDYDFSTDESYYNYELLLLMTNLTDENLTVSREVELTDSEGNPAPTGKFTIPAGKTTAICVLLPDEMEAEDIVKNKENVKLKVTIGDDEQPVELEVQARMTE